MPDILLKPVPHKEASQFIATKPVLARQAFDHLLPDLKARAFTITGVESANVVQAVRDRIAELPLGADWDEVKQDIADRISPWLDEGSEDRKSDSDHSASQRRAELLLRTHGFQAYTVAAEEVAARQRDAFPFAQYLSAQDDSVRDSHAALDGIVVPADSPFWDRHTPPWEWGCRCQKVYLQAEDVAEMQKEDAAKKPEAHRVLSAERLNALEKSNQLTVAGDGGMPRFVSVEPSKTFTFDRSTIKMSAEELRPRYDPETFATFEKWAKVQQTEQGVSVWTWLTQKPAAAPQSTTPTPPAPAPAPVAPAPAAGPDDPAPTDIPPKRQSPVSAALEVRTTARHAADIHRTLAAIDRVHDDGDLPKVPIIGRASGARGVYQFTRAGQPVQIGIADLPKYWSRLTTAHEIGHLLDHQVLGARGTFASESHPMFADFRAAVLGSRAVQEIRGQFSDRQQAYYLSPHELWARAYAQYIAKKSGDAILTEQLTRARGGLLQPASLQWDDSDFAPIELAIDGILRAKGWIK